MGDWFSWLTRERVLDIGLALALGTALATFLEKLAEISVGALAQHVGRNPYEEDDSILGLLDLFSAPYLLNFSIGGTVIAYGPILSALIVLALVGLAAVLVVRRRDRELGECPHCASRIPYASRHCAYCGSGVSPGEP